MSRIDDDPSPTDGGDEAGRCLRWAIILVTTESLAVVPLVVQVWRKAVDECRPGPLAGVPWWLLPWCWFWILVNVVIWVIVLVIAIVFYRVCLSRAPALPGQDLGTHEGLRSAG